MTAQALVRRNTVFEQALESSKTRRPYRWTCSHGTCQHPRFVSNINKEVTSLRKQPVFPRSSPPKRLQRRGETAVFVVQKVNECGSFDKLKTFNFFFHFYLCVSYSHGADFCAKGRVISGHLANKRGSRFGTNTKLLRSRTSPQRPHWEQKKVAVARGVI